MNYKKLLVYAPTKAIFETALANSVADQNCVAYIEEPRMIWAQGNYYPCPYTKEEIDQLVQNNKDEFERIIAELKGNVTEEYNTLEKIENKIKEEVLRAQQKESELDTKIEAETNRAQEAENNLDQKLDQEIERAKSAESTLNQQITDEVNRAKEAEQTLTEGLNDANESIQDIRDTYLPLAGGTMSGSITFESIDVNGHEYVDLGLPSGNLWAKYNIEATSEEEAGLYFQWGDTQGYTPEQIGKGEELKAFSWDDYKWSVDGSSSNFSKYNDSDGKTVLDLEDDAAHVLMGGNWRMPTLEEYKELCLNTDIYLVPTEGEEIQGTAQDQGQRGGITIKWASPVEGTLKGVKFYKKGDKQTYMFVPAPGFAYDGSVQYVGQNGRLWTSSRFSSNVRYAWYFYFGANVGGVEDGSGRVVGVPVRGVCPKSYTGNIITVSGKTSTDLLNAAGSTTTIDTVRDGLATKEEVNNSLNKYVPKWSNMLLGVSIADTGSFIANHQAEDTPTEGNHYYGVSTSNADIHIGKNVLSIMEDGQRFFTPGAGYIFDVFDTLPDTAQVKFTGSGITFPNKTTSDLLNAAGSTTVLKTIGGESLLGEGNIELATDADIDTLFGVIDVGDE